MKITLDTTILPAGDLLSACGGYGWEFVVVTVTERETEGTSFNAMLEPLDKIMETAVWGESKWGEAVWGSEDTADDLDEILAIISHGSFPTDRQSLSTGERHQLRDAMIFQAHVRDKRDVFVTKDSRAFIWDGRCEKLQRRFNTRIMTPEEFLAFCGEQHHST